MLGVYLTNTAGALIRVATNDDCFVWVTNTPTSGWSTTNGPTNDVISRLRLNADNNVPYRIARTVP
jgi:hypothetical protein